MNPLKSLLAPLVALAALLAPVQPSEATTDQPAPHAGSVTIAGDSITLQTTLTGASWPGALVHAGLGWQVADAWPYVYNDATQGHDQVFVYALGMNDASPDTGGWTMDDVWAMRYMLAIPPIPGSCEVIVLPGSGVGMSQAHKDALVQERVWAKYVITPEKIQAGRKVVVVDWQSVIDADPSVVAPDGIHLKPDPAGPFGLSQHAGDARKALYQQGIDGCHAQL